MRRNIALAALGAAAGMMLAFAPAAEAHHKHHHHHWHGVKFVIGHSGPGCGYYYWKWQDTGAYYWKKQFHICKGWW